MSENRAFFVFNRTSDCMIGKKKDKHRNIYVIHKHNFISFVLIFRIVTFKAGMYTIGLVSLLLIMILNILMSLMLICKNLSP